MNMNCLDLEAAFGAHYRIGHEPVSAGKPGKNVRVRDPWLQVIRCQHGHIYVHGTDTLGVATNRRGATCKKLAALPGLVVVQDGTDGINAVFPIELLPKVAEIVRPKRRRQFTPEQQAANAARLAKYQFRPAAHDDSGAKSRDPAAGTGNDSKSGSDASAREICASSALEERVTKSIFRE